MPLNLDAYILRPVAVFEDDALRRKTLGAENLAALDRSCKSKYRATDLPDLVQRFVAHGGSAVFGPEEEEFDQGSGDDGQGGDEGGDREEKRAPADDAKGGVERKPSASKTRFAVGIEPDDLVYAVCHEGMNRSQVMSIVLERVKVALGVDVSDALRGGVAPPHGAEGGFDPHVGYRDLTADNFFSYTHGVIRDVDEPGEWMHRCFRKVFGRAKAKRIGAAEAEANGLALNPVAWDAAEWPKLEHARQHMRAYFDRHYFCRQDQPVDADAGIVRAAPGGGTGEAAAAAAAAAARRPRMIFFCFMRAAGIVTRRLVEVADELQRKAGMEQRVPACADMYVVALPWGDNISHAGGRDEVKAAIEAGDEAATREGLNEKAHARAYRTYCRIIQPIVGTSTDDAKRRGAAAGEKPEDGQGGAGADEEDGAGNDDGSKGGDGGGGGEQKHGGADLGNATGGQAGGGGGGGGGAVQGGHQARRAAEDDMQGQHHQGDGALTTAPSSLPAPDVQGGGSGGGGGGGDTSAPPPAAPGMEDAIDAGIGTAASSRTGASVDTDIRIRYQASEVAGIESFFAFLSNPEEETSTTASSAGATADVEMTTTTPPSAEAESGRAVRDAILADDGASPAPAAAR